MNKGVSAKSSAIINLQAGAIFKLCYTLKQKLRLCAKQHRRFLMPRIYSIIIFNKL